MHRFSYIALTFIALSVGAAHAAEPYKHGPDSERQPGVPQGKVTKFTHPSKVFPDTARQSADGRGAQVYEI